MAENADDDIQPFKFKWKIENFLFSNDSFTSPAFTIESFHKTKWNIEIYPKSTVEGCISIYLNRMNDNGPGTVTMDYEYSIVTSDDLFALPLKTENVQMNKNRRTVNKSWKRDQLLNERSLYFQDNSFTVQCKIWPYLTTQPLLNSLTALTFVGADKFSFKICVQNFSSCYSGQPVKVIVPMSYKLEITLKVENSGDDFVSIDIRKCDGNANYFLVCNLSLLDIRGISQDSKKAEHMFGKKEEIWHFPPFIRIQKLNLYEKSLLSDDILFLNCEMTASAGKVILSRIVDEERSLQADFSIERLALLDTLSNNLEKLYLEKQFYDVELRSGNSTFEAHRAILSCRSTVFQAMFQCNMAEKETGIVDIIDIDPATLGEFLAFIYSGNIKDLNVNRALKLFSAADKYQVLQLKEICSSFLCKNITSKNACEILHLADVHGDELLKQAVEQYFYDHSCEVLASDAWNSLITNNITLAGEMLRRLSKKYQK